MALIVSAGLPTGMEGMMYPIPFSEPDAVLRVARHAEALGFHSVWGNDHMTTQHRARPRSGARATPAGARCTSACCRCGLRP